MSLSFFSELYIVLISFYLFYKYTINIRAKKEKEKKEVKKKEIQFLGLEPKFYYSLDLNLSNHIFAFKFEFCVKNKENFIDKKRKQKKKHKKK